MMRTRTEKEIERIIVHCSDSKWGDIKAIEKWHKEKGFSRIGYHWVITNGFIKPDSEYDPTKDGLIQTGRPYSQVGAHCKGKNRTSLGVCLIGKELFSANQLYRALPLLLGNVMHLFNLKVEDIYGHHDFNNHKTCPNIGTDMLRGLFRRI